MTPRLKRSPRFDTAIALGQRRVGTRTNWVASEAWIGSELILVGTEGAGLREQKAPAERSPLQKVPIITAVRIAILANGLAPGCC